MQTLVVQFSVGTNNLTNDEPLEYYQ